jgi:hypothetical protein
MSVGFTAVWPRDNRLHFHGNLSFPRVPKYGVPQGSTLGPLVFNIFIKDICDCTFNSKYLLSAYDLKIYRSINNVHDCKLLQSYIMCKIGVLKMELFLMLVKLLLYHLLRKTVSFNFIYYYVIILFYVSSLSKMLQFCWTLFSSPHWLHIFSRLKNIGFVSLYYLFLLHFS